MRKAIYGADWADRNIGKRVGVSEFLTFGQ